MDLRTIILKEIRSILNEQGKESQSEYHDEMAIFDTGLDSLGFAMLVTRLEEVLGYDPFVEMTHAYYPRTFGDFVSVYKDRPV